MILISLLKLYVNRNFKSEGNEFRIILTDKTGTKNHPFTKEAGLSVDEFDLVYKNSSICTQLMFKLILINNKHSLLKKHLKIKGVNPAYKSNYPIIFSSENNYIEIVK